MKSGVARTSGMLSARNFEVSRATSRFSNAVVTWHLAAGLRFEYDRTASIEFSWLSHSRFWYIVSSIVCAIRMLTVT